MRPNIDPVGQESVEDVVKLRQMHLKHVRQMFETLDVMVFTLGLTEAWVSLEDETVFPTAPGTIANSFDPKKHKFVNFGFSDVQKDLEAFWAALKQVNPGARMLLTVSPVPLIATATSDHVIVATTYSKSVLRAVAGEFATAHEDVTYFPSYEIITAVPGRGMFFDPDWRGVNPSGVRYVMEHFFSGPLAETFQTSADPVEAEVVCDEEAMLEA